MYVLAIKDKLYFLHKTITLLGEVVLSG